MNENANLILLKAKGGASRLIKDLLDDLDLQKVVTRSECTQLLPSALDSPGAYHFRIGPCYLASVFRSLEILMCAVSSLHRPFGSFGENLFFFIGGELEVALRTHTGRDMMIQGAYQIF